MTRGPGARLTPDPRLFSAVSAKTFLTSRYAPLSPVIPDWRLLWDSG